MKADMFDICGGEIEKRIEELDAAVRGYGQITASPAELQAIKKNILASLEKVIDDVKFEKLSSALSVRLGELCFHLNFFENARYFLEKALALEPGNSDALNNLGVISLQNREVATAQDFFINALAVKPDNMDAMKNLALLHKDPKDVKGEAYPDPDEKVELRDMKKYWDACAADNAMRHIAVDNWESEDIFHASGERDLDKILSFLDNELLKNNNYKVLEVGCGIGRLLKPFAMKYPKFEIYGVDVSKEMIGTAELRLKEFDNIRLVSNNGRDLKMFDDKLFHIIYSYVVLQHIPRKFVRNYFVEISRTLMENGLFIFQLPLRSNIRYMEPPDTDFRTVRDYSEEEINLLCNSNQLEIVKAIPITEYHGSPSAWFITVKR